MTKAFWLDLLQRVGIGTAVAFLGSLAAAQTTEGLTLSALHAAYIAAAFAAIRTALGLVTALYGDKNSAAVVSVKPKAKRRASIHEAIGAGIVTPAEVRRQERDTPIHDHLVAESRPKVTVAVLREIGGRGPLGRHIEHDPRSRNFAVTATRDAGKAVRWTRRAPIFNQGDVGSCTGNAMAGWIGTDNATRKGVKAENEADAVALYTLATKLDSIPGSYPAQDTGSSGLAVAKAAKQLGRITSYVHAFTIDQALSALANGPVITGTNWLTGMDSPNAAGLVHAAGSVRGGHEYEVIGYDPNTGLVECCNSWGRGFGRYGRFFMSLDDWSRLLKQQGDVTAPVA